MRRNRTWAGALGCVGLGLGIAYMVAMGPLDPPPGAVSSTSPSLADLEDKLDQVIAGQAGSGEITGPWEVFRVPAVGTLADNPQSTLVAGGDVYVHSLTALDATAVVFDGPGSIDPVTSYTLTGDWIAEHFHHFATSGSGRGQYGATTVPVEQTVEGGLHVAWDSYSTNSFLYVLYKPLP